MFYAGGGLDWLELKTLDLRFLYANPTPESGDLVCIDIDDASIDQVGRWPWPRDVQAGVISVLGEAGVKALLVDITLGEPETARFRLPRGLDMVADPLTLDLKDAVLVLPDYEIRAAIAQLRDIYLACDYSNGASWRDVLWSDGFAAVLDALTSRQEPQARTLIEQLPLRRPRQGEPAWDPWLWARLVHALEMEPGLTPETLADQIDPRSAPAIRRAEDACREVALFRRVRAWLDAQPERWTAPPAARFDALLADLAGGSAVEGTSAAEALRRVLSYQATLQKPLVPLEAVASAARPVDDVAPVYFLHARAARRCGFVVFEPDPDGVMRRVRLLVQHEGHVLPQLAFAVAFDQLGLGPTDVRAGPGRLVLRKPGAAQPLVIELDDQGRALVPWVAQRDWTQQFGTHVPALAAAVVFDRRTQIIAAQAQARELLEVLLSHGVLTEYGQYHEDLDARLKLDQKLRLARYGNDEQVVRDSEGYIAEYEKLLAEAEPKLRAAVAAARGVAFAPATQGSDEPDAVSKALDQIERAFAAIDEHRTVADATLRQIRQRVAGKIGLLGYTATALADMTPIPTHPRAPGVMAHANLLSGLLTGHTVSWAPGWLNGLLAGLLGLLATIMSVRWGPRIAGVVVLLVVGYAAVAGWLVFYAQRYWIALTPAIGAVVASYVMVVVYRYVFLERERRQLTTALSQYTSATLARKMAEDADLCRRAESREVTAVFTDLANFTTISERIGAERTQHVLNVALGRFSDVMLRHEAMINKFIGDGIFAFWNPVIYPQPDHALRACQTAVELQTGLQELIAEQREAHGDEAFSQLILRIGVATGHAIVGPCGSEQKYDYTCIGDSVNVASRLESANKFYGTRILVSGATRDQVAEQFIFRPLGGVRVKGKTQAVPIFELLGVAAELADELQQYGARFAAGIAAFQQRAWVEARQAFEVCLRQRPDDMAAHQYVEAVRRFVAAPPGGDWTGALELTEK